MKQCARCGEAKSFDDFHKNASKKDGLQSYCKPCLLSRNKQWHDANPEKRARIAAKWYDTNRDAAIATARRWAIGNKARVTARVSRRDAEKLRATPAWANRFFIEEAYDLARRLSEVFGFPWHVDHIVPLRSKWVCGLHTELNLRVIPAQENIRKGNRHWPDMPEFLKQERRT